jgi:1-acyl-sn-glycerol-3-phosphate acyltransferase
VIDGAFECWSRHKKLFSHGSIVVSYGKVIPAGQAKNMGNEKLAEVLTETLRKMQNESRIKQGKKPYDY